MTYRIFSRLQYVVLFQKKWYPYLPPLPSLLPSPLSHSDVIFWFKPSPPSSLEISGLAFGSPLPSEFPVTAGSLGWVWIFSGTAHSKITAASICTQYSFWFNSSVLPSQVWFGLPLCKIPRSHFCWHCPRGWYNWLCCPYIPWSIKDRQIQVLSA